MKNILVTGGAGFIGSNFAHYLLPRVGACRIVVFDKLTYAGHKESIEGPLRSRKALLVRGDIADPRQVRAVLRKYRPGTVLNFAAESHVDRSIDGPEDFIRTNVVGVFHLLQETRRFWEGLGPSDRKRFRLLHVSTDEVYGSLGPKGSFREDTPYAPNSPYAATKAGADHLVRAYHQTFGLPVLLTNCSNNYGPYQYPEKLIPLMILNALEGKPLPVYGDGGNVRDWLYVEDHCSALWRVVRAGKPGEKYNVGGDSERSNLQVVRAICDGLEDFRPASRNPALSRKGVRSYGRLMTFVKDRPGHDRRYAIDASKIRKELGWRPRKDFSQGIRATLEWYLNNLDWCRKVQKGTYRRQRLGILGPGKGKA
ncbi:MAG TPA: dTDP-glucose 4,6-dehydratase [bacterium]|nr:dTDP-glucose 4,6-dehydratase [bacterium]